MDGLNIKATALIKLTKLDELGKVIGVEEHEIELSEEEVKVLCPSQQQV